MFKAGTLNMTNCTISGNDATNGGAIIDGSASTMNITQCTIASNTAITQGGGIDLRAATMNMKNTILAGNTSPSGANYYNEDGGTLLSGGYNLCDGALAEFSSIGDITSATLNIGVLADNGGATQSHELLAGSDAINAIPEGGNNFNGAPVIDQRGISRPQGNNVDIGAFELVVEIPGLWTGATDSDWSTASNWDDGNVPNGTVDVTIPSGCGNYPVIDEAAVCQDITIQNGGTVTIDIGSSINVSGDFILQDGGTFTNNGTLQFSGANSHISDNRGVKSTLGNVLVEE